MAAAVRRGHEASEGHSQLSFEQKNKESIRRRGRGHSHETMIIRTFNKAIQI